MTGTFWRCERTVSGSFELPNGETGCEIVRQRRGDRYLLGLPDDHQSRCIEWAHGLFGGSVLGDGTNGPVSLPVHVTRRTD
jgi:hypothetical protein